MRSPLPILLALALASCLPESTAPDLTGVPVRLTLLHTSDIHSRLFPYDMIPQFTDVQLGLSPDNGPYGGAARMKWILDDERSRARRALHLDSGDVFQGAPVFNVFEGEVEVRMHNVLGTDAVVMGNHEFDAGATNYATQLERWATFPSLAANYDFASSSDIWNNRLESFAHPWFIWDLEGLSVGVVGMGNLSSLTSIHEPDNGMDVYARSTMPTVLQHTAFLAEHVDIVIVLTHLSLDDDVEIARTDPNVDIVLGGHLHVALDPVKVVESEVVPGKRVVVSHAGAFAKYVQRLDFVVQDGDVLAWENKLVPIDSTVPQDPQMLELLDEYTDRLGAAVQLDRIIGYTSDRLRRFGTDGGDSPLGNLTAEAMRFHPAAQTDFALTNSLGIRSDIQGPGDGEQLHAITLEELFNVMPFDNTITNMFLSGTEVQELFDYTAARSASRGCSTQVQIAGARFEMICGESGGHAENVSIGGSWTPCIDDEDCPDIREICSADACGVPIDPTRSYSLATNNYIAQGGSGFYMLDANTTQDDTGISIRDSVELFIDQLTGGSSEVTIGEFYPDGDGRIAPRL